MAVFVWMTLFDQYMNKTPYVRFVINYIDNLLGVEARIGHSGYIFTHLIRVYTFITLEPFKSRNLYEHLALEYNLGRKVSIRHLEPD